MILVKIGTRDNTKRLKLWPEIGIKESFSKFLFSNPTKIEDEDDN